MGLLRGTIIISGLISHTPWSFLSIGTFAVLALTHMTSIFCSSVKVLSNRYAHLLRYSSDIIMQHLVSPLVKIRALYPPSLIGFEDL